MAKKLPPQESLPRESGEDDKLQAGGGAREHADDESLLEEFCRGVSFEDIEFASWQAVHRNLDLQLELVLSREEAFAGGQRRLEFVRSISRLAPEGQLVDRHKEKVVQQLSWPAKLATDSVIVLAGEGDRYGLERGDVLVKLRISKS